MSKKITIPLFCLCAKQITSLSNKQAIFSCNLAHTDSDIDIETLEAIEENQTNDTFGIKLNR